MSSARHRPVRAVDITASALARVAPSALRPHIDQARHDLNALFAPAEVPFATPSRAARPPRPLASIDPLAEVLPRGLRARYETLRSDLRWLARDLSGVSRPALVERGPSRYAKPSLDRNKAKSIAPRLLLSPRPLRVTRVERETKDAVSLTVEERDGSPLVFEAGQFLTFHLVVDGVALRRAYSLSVSPLDGAARVTVKHIDGGRGSRFMTREVREGAELHALGPSGSFLAPSEASPRELVMISGGSGITPLHSIARTVLAARPEFSVRLLYGNRAPEDVIFASQLEALARAHPSRLAITHALEQAPADHAGLSGRLDAPTIGAWLDALPREAAPRVYYLCGPTAMMEAAEAELARRGATEIRVERFQSPGERQAPALTRAVTVQLRVRGADHLARVEPGQTLLEAGLAAGAALPFSCAMGGCAACKGRLVAGEVAMEEPNCLTPAERSAGAVLTCCARPLGDGVRVEIGN